MKRFFVLLLLISNFTFGQTYSSKHFGASLGLVFNMGTHVNSVGISVNTYYQDFFYQVNLGSTFTLNDYSYGSRKNFIESRSSLGLVLLAGKRELTPDFQLNGLLHNSSFNYGVSYNYIFYYDNAGTSQLSGGWGAHLKNLSLLFENDVFGGQAKDRFRTGHFTVNYRYRDLKFTTGLYLWTGETANSVWQKVPLDECPSGFRILEDLPYGRTSHGILYGGISMNLGLGQTGNFRVGWDSEKVRHAVQNRFTHDLILLPKSFKRNTPHYPRLDQNGCAVFEDTLIRKDKFYMQFGVNENWSN